MTWLSLLCPSCRPADLSRWLRSLWHACDHPKEIELSLTLETPLDEADQHRWGNVITSMVQPRQFTINALTEQCYRQSSSPYIFLSGDDTICRTDHWDTIFKTHLARYPDGVVLLYPDDRIFGAALACYPVTSRLVMDQVPWPVPYERYCVDDTIFDIVPRNRRIYLPDVVMEHQHLVDHPPGHPIVRDGVTRYYPHEVEAMSRDRAKYAALQPERDRIRRALWAFSMGC